MSNGIGQRPTEKFYEAASQSIVRGKKKKKGKSGSLLISLKIKSEAKHS